MIKKIILVLILVLILGGIFIFRNNFLPEKHSIDYYNPTLPLPNSEGNEFTPELPSQSLPLSNTPKDIAWALFQKYLSYNQAQNLDGVRSVVYKVASVCNDPKTTIDCKARMSAAYSYGGVLKKEDFINIWSDEKQIILSTNFKINEDESMIGRNRAIIFFIKDESGNLKMLSFSPFKGAIISKGAASKEELNDRLIIYTEDVDEDGRADYDEECLGAKEGEICPKTNPKIRDTDNNGFWDGVDALMK